jgi:hypothetical protein
MSEKLLEIEIMSPDGGRRHVYVPLSFNSFLQFAFPYDETYSGSRSYDKLIIGVGSVSATHGVDGLENCFQLKTIADARNIRRRILGKRPPSLQYKRCR